MPGRPLPSTTLARHTTRHLPTTSAGIYCLEPQWMGNRWELSKSDGYHLEGRNGYYLVRLSDFCCFMEIVVQNY